MKAKNAHSKAAAAMGPRELDELTVSNQWASVTIVRDGMSGEREVFELSGDADRPTYPTRAYSASAALALALDHLAIYEQGRCD